MVEPSFIRVTNRLSFEIASLFCFFLGVAHAGTAEIAEAAARQGGCFEQFVEIAGHVAIGHRRPDGRGEDVAGFLPSVAGKLALHILALTMPA